MDTNEIKMLTEKARHTRIKIIDIIAESGEGHVGGSMSIVELLTILYVKYMRVNPKDPSQKERDRLVLSKGHAGPALYCILADMGFFPEEWLHTLNRGGTRLPSHCDKNTTPGIDMSTGSLGQGISAAVGMAVGLKLDRSKSVVYCVIGDGESQEGQVWEAAMSASHFRLHNLIVFTDYNKFALDGLVEDVMGIADITSKWVAFGWYTQRANGHDFNQLEMAINNALKEPCRPSMIVLDTVKGKGCSFAEGSVLSHKMAVSRQQAENAIQRLNSGAV